MSKKGTYKVIASTDRCELYINGFISGWDLDRLDALCNQQVIAGQKNIFIFIDSFGGDAFSAQRIGNTIDRFIGDVSCHIGLIAASAASYIVAKCKNRSIAANGQIMFHKPMITAGGNIDEVQANLKMLQSMTTDFSKVYAAVMNKTEEEINQMWTSDYWMDAEEALALGFVSEIGEPVETVDSDVVAELKSAGRWSFPEPQTTTHPPTQDMSKNALVLAALNLPENSDETAVLAAVKSLNTARETAERRVQQLEQEAETRQKDAVKTLVEAAIKDGKITEGERERYTKLATADFNETAGLLADKKPHVTATSQLNNGAAPAADKYADWNYDRLSKEAPEVLAEIKTNDPERFKSLREKHIKG